MIEPLPDSEARQRAWKSIGDNLVVEAAAGTGKTEVLAFHYLSRLFGRHRSCSPPRPLLPEEIVAITFTERAAAEMRLRISEHLGRILSELPWEPDPPDKEAERAHRLRALLDHAQCGRDAAVEKTRDYLRRLERSRIGTIHSFCAHLLRMHPVESGVDPGFGVDSGAEFDLFFGVEWEKWARQALSHVDAPALRAVLAEFSLPDLRAFAKSLAGHLRPDDLPTALARRGQDGAAVDPLLLEALRILEPFAKQTREEFIRKGYIPFDALLAKTIRLLRNHPSVREGIRLDFKALLVDEFQDTDPIQAEIVLWLSGERNHPPDPAHPMGRWSLEPGRLFIVGDPKQSVYSFRNADVAIYESVKDILKANSVDPIHLQTSFRSAPAIIRASNAVFERVFHGPENPQHVPLKIQPGHESLPGSVDLFLCETGDADAEKAGNIEGAALARWLREVVEPELTRPDGTVEWGRAAILARKMTTISPILDRLRQAGIPHSVHGTKHFYARPEVTDFLNLLQAIDNPADRTSLAGVLRSPLGACTDQELFDLNVTDALRTTADRGKLPSGHIRWIYDVLEDLHRASERLTLEEIVNQAISRLPILEIASAGYDGDQAVANLLKIRRLASEQGALGLSLRSFVFGMRRKKRDLEEEAESPVSEESLDALHVLTIHQSKGLEYDVVVVPMMNQGIQLRPDKQPRVTWNSFRNLTAAVLGERHAGDVEALEALNEKLVEQEARRLLYVAMTRAKRRLALWGTSKQGTRSKLPLLEILHAVPGIKEALATANAVPLAYRPDSNTVRRDADRSFNIPGGQEVRNDVESAMIHIQRFETPESHEQTRRGRSAQPAALSIPSDFVNRWERRVEEYRTRQGRLLFTSPTTSVGQPTELQVPAAHPTAATGSMALWIGSLCHAALMWIDFKDPRDVSHIVERASVQLSLAAGPVPRETLEAATDILERFTRSAPFADLARAEILARELPFVRRLTDGRVMRGAIDVVYRLDGRLVVADYKTDAISGSEAIRERAQAYTVQLRLYRDAIADGLGERPQAQVIFLRPGETVPIYFD